MRVMVMVKVMLRVRTIVGIWLRVIVMFMLNGFVIV